MDNLTLEQRITRLEDIESIRYLQAKYQRCLDTRDFDALAECFCEDAKSFYGDGKMSYDGKEAIMEFLMKVMTLDMPSTHLIHGGEIDWIDENNARAKWYLEDHLVHKKYLLKLHGAAIYNIVYQKINGIWYIKEIGYNRCYQYFEGRGLLNLTTLSNLTFFKNVKNADPNTLGEYGKYFQYHTLRKKKK